MISLFYRDLIFNIDKFKLDFGKIYQFGMDYMVHYPKLQVTYPPLWHLVNGLITYSLFGVSEFTAKITSLFFSASSIIVLYFLLKHIFNPKIALLSTALFFVNPMSILFSYRALIDFSSWLFIFVALYAYLKAEKTGKIIYYLLTGLFFFLATMGQRPAILLLPAVFVYSFFVKKEFKKSLLMVTPFILLMIPYGLILWKTGGLAINVSVVETAGTQQGEPTLFTIDNWIWYLAKFVKLSGPFALIAFGALLYYFYKKEPHWKLLLVWLTVFWIGLSVPQNKEPRFYQWLFLPAYFAFSFYAVNLIGKYKLKMILPIAGLILIYLIFSYSFIYADMNYNHVSEAEKFMQKNLTGNIAILSEEGKTYSSEFIFLTAAADEKKEKFVYRPCAFLNKTSTDIKTFFSDNNIQYAVFLKSGDMSYIGGETIEKIKDGLEFRKGFGGIDIYEVKNFTFRQKEICNYVCLTKEIICTANTSPLNIIK